MHGDPTCQRIDWLLSSQLRKVASSVEYGDWEVLYVDPADGRFWELTYPQGDLPGGGPPRIEAIPVDIARRKYR